MGEMQRREEATWVALRALVEASIADEVREDALSSEEITWLADRVTDDIVARYRLPQG